MFVFVFVSKFHSFTHSHMHSLTHSYTCRYLQYKFLQFSKNNTHTRTQAHIFFFSCSNAPVIVCLVIKVFITTFFIYFFFVFFFVFVLLVYQQWCGVCEVWKMLCAKHKKKKKSRKMLLNGVGMVIIHVRSFFFFVSSLLSLVLWQIWLFTRMLEKIFFL